MADWLGIIKTVSMVITNYLIKEQDRAVDRLADISSEQFKEIYENRNKKGDAAKKMIERAAEKRNWK